MGTTVLFREDRFQWSRSSAISVTLALHALAALAILAPPAMQTLQQRMSQPTEAITIKPIEPPPKPVPTLTVERKIKPPPVAQRQPVKPPAPTPAPVETTQLTPMSTPVVPTSAPDLGLPAGPVDTTPTALGYRSMKSVPYPAEAARKRQEGTVMLRVLVGPDGVPQEITVERSSGYTLLDRAAREAVMKWRFTPGTRDGQAFAAYGLVPIAFRLNEL